MIQFLKGFIDTNTLISNQRTEHTIDFSEVENADLRDFRIEFSFEITKTGMIFVFLKDYYIFLYLQFFSYHAWARWLV